MSDTLIPRIAVIGCGGTISSFGTSNLDVMDYPDEGRKLSVHEVLAHVPEVGQIAQIVPVAFRDVSSTALTVEDWLRLRKVIRTLCSEQLDLAGIIILHGTGTLEETAFFLNLTLDVPQTVVVVVDAQLRVRGVKNLRIADASIMPTITTGNTQAPCVIIGERWRRSSRLILPFQGLPDDGVSHLIGRRRRAAARQCR